MVGLGNPGREYNWSRHNFGFLALDFYAKLAGLEWGEMPKFRALVARDGDTLLVKPQTFYNEVGQSVASVLQFYKLNLAQDLLVLADDFELPFGSLRYRAHGSAGGNNGLKSIISAVGADFPRLRLGTGNDTERRKLGDVDFVLAKFTPEERAELPTILLQIQSQITENVLKPAKNR